MANAETEKTTEPTVDATDLAKSIALLEAALGTTKGETVEKAVIGTGGGLQAATPSDGDINKDIKDDDEEEDASPAEAAASETAAVPALADGTVACVSGHDTKKSIEGEALDIPASDEEFAKSLSAAFSEAAPLVDAAKGSAFAKSLVLSTIEGLSVTCDEITKSLADSESRTSTRIDSLEKALSTALTGINEILKNVQTVANSPVRTTAKSVQVLEKSISNSPERANLSKAQVSEALLSMAKQGKTDAFAVSRFESTGQIDPALLAEITKGTGR
jgi:hypothetical protein